MCFLTAQVLEFIQKHRLGDLLIQIKPMYTYLNLEAPTTEKERIASDLATNAGTFADYGPEDFSTETLLKVVQHLQETDPAVRGRLFALISLKRPFYKALWNFKDHVAKSSAVPIFRQLVSEVSIRSECPFFNAPQSLRKHRRKVGNTSSFALFCHLVKKVYP